MKKFITIIICLVIIMGIMPINAAKAGRDYYISSSLGDDANDGKSEEAPWKSFKNVSSLHLTAGDRILLRRGDVWNERLTVNGSGTSESWIYVGPYGELTQPAPEISLNNGRNDICILATDLTSPDKDTHALNYIHIEGLSLKNSYLGIYFRYAVSENNVGVKVTNCSFTNINCPDLMKEALTSIAFIAEAKGDLPTLTGGKYSETGGGAYEYIWPAAIIFGGRPEMPLASVEISGKCRPCTKVSEITIDGVYMDGCIDGIASNPYNLHYGWGKDAILFEYIKNINISDLTAENSMTVINIDSADFGWDGTESSEWGTVKNLQAKSGMADYSMSSGTTHVLISTVRNLYIKNSSFIGNRNNGQPDGCGFDFERECHNVTLENCIIADNEGQGVLMMQTTGTNQITGEQVTSPSSNVTLKNCLFYNNMQNVYNENYCFDFTVFNSDNENILLTGCHFVFKENTNGGAQVPINTSSKRNFTFRPYGETKRGITAEDCTFERYASDLPTLESVINARGLTNSVMADLPLDISVSPQKADTTADITSPLLTGTAEVSTSDTPEKAASYLPIILGVSAFVVAAAAITVLFVLKKKKSSK